MTGFEVRTRNPAIQAKKLNHRTSSPIEPSPSNAAATMLGQPEDSEGPRTAKLARDRTSSPDGQNACSTQTSSRSPSDQANHTQPVPDTHLPNATQLLAGIGILEFLAQDERPTFVIDVADSANTRSGFLSLIFANAALKTRVDLLDLVRGGSDDPGYACAGHIAFAEFKEWALSSFTKVGAEACQPPIYPYAGSVWRCLALRERIRVIVCEPTSTSSTIRELPNNYKIRQRNELNSPSPALSADSSHYSGYFSQVNSEHNSRCSQSPVNLIPHSPAEFLGRQQPRNSPRRPSVTGYGGVKSMEALSSIQCNESHPGAKPHTERPGSGGSFQVGSQEVISDQGFFDWTRLPESSALSPHVRFARSVNWAATSLGPIESWDADLRAMCNLVMASPHPAALYWGPDLVVIYNEAYILLAGSKHPTLMGQTYREAWSEIWDIVKDAFASARSSAEATMKDDDRLFLSRDGSLEETYFLWSIVPLIGTKGSVVGLYNPAFEKTRRKIAERRMLTLREVGEMTGAARQVSHFWPLLLRSLEYNELDVPFVLVYSVTDDLDSDDSSTHSTGTVTQKTLVLEGSLGVPSGHNAAPGTIDLSKSMRGFAPAFRSAVKTNKPIILSEKDGTLDMELLKGIQWRGFGDPSSTVVICPIHPTRGESTLGFLVLGTNPRRPFDKDYDLFVQLLARQLATSVASVVLSQKEIRRNEQAARLAAQDRFELSKQLAARTQEAEESEIKFSRMAELAPVGMFIADSTGRLNYCNDTWYELSSYPRGECPGEDWMEYVATEDKTIAMKYWREIMDSKEPISAEFRFKTPWQDRVGNRLHQTWVLASAYPERGLDGQVNRIFGSITDITTQKFATEQQKRRMEEAVELKRQQENFIDITSHEMRNPLSAILQCADEISISLTEARNDRGLQTSVLDSSIDAAQTIILCAQHQKRIVDDVLTLSKLDSARLLVTPVDVQPAGVMQLALKMFQGELQTADISLDFRVDESLHDLRVDWVRLDPSRLLQVLINLTTNAIKFTTAQEKRLIVVRLGASMTRPSEQRDKAVDYIPSRTGNMERDTASAPEWGLGEVIYISFAIQDTGMGLTESEKKLLFHRFSQASPRTHITYGGSGLGLFISRELVELQGGEIGVSSETGRGCTFAFYIKARRSFPPPEDAQDPSNAAQVRKGSGSKKGRISMQNLSSVELARPSIPPYLTPASIDVQSPLKVLIVEDNLINQKVLAKQLQKMGFIVYLANHGAEAIDRLMSSRFWKGKETVGIEIDVILMDLEMPVMDGLTCARKIRALQSSGNLVKHVPVIAVTANAREEQIAISREAGVDDVMSKPFRIPELLPKIRALAGRNQRHAEIGP